MVGTQGGTTKKGALATKMHLTKEMEPLNKGKGKNLGGKRQEREIKISSLYSKSLGRE